MPLERFIVVRFQVEGFHRWADAPEHRDYLAQRHRHIFHVTAKLQVAHNEREVEFHDFLAYCRKTFPGGEMNTASCETMAEHILKEIIARWGVQRACEVTVSEDGEVDAIVSWKPTPGSPFPDLRKQYQTGQ